MDLMQLYTFCEAKPAVAAVFPFGPDTLVFKVAGKVFALVALDQWEQGKQQINLKCDPEYALQLRADYEAITPGFHMNKKHWNTVDLALGQISWTFLSDLIDHSYAMVVKSMSKKLRDTL